MTLDEAIKHAEEVAEAYTKYNIYGDFESCDECGKEHQQLAEWLKELKQLREQKDVLNKIKAEIEDLTYYSWEISPRTVIDDVLEIIDKYREGDNDAEY